MARTYDPTIKAGAALIATADAPKLLSSYATVTSSATKTADDVEIDISSNAPISGYVNYSTRQALIGIVRETGEGVIAFDSTSTSVRLIRGLARHPSWKEKGSSTFAQAISNGDSIDFYAYFTFPGDDDYIEVNEGIEHEEAQDTFMTQDNLEKYDTIASSTAEVTLRFKPPHNVSAHPNGMGMFFSNDRIVNDGHTTNPSYTRKIGSVGAGESLDGKIVIVLPKDELGNTYTTDNTASAKTVQDHNTAEIFWNMKFAPAKTYSFANDAQREIDVEGSACAFTFTDYNNKQVIWGRGFQDFFKDMHALLEAL